MDRPVVMMCLCEYIRASSGMSQEGGVVRCDRDSFMTRRKSTELTQKACNAADLLAPLGLGGYDEIKQPVY